MEEAVDVGLQLEALSFAHSLYGHPAPELLTWLSLRGIDTATADTWGLGYAPAGDTLARAIPDRLIPAAESVGLIARSRHRRGHYDRLDRRITFPLVDRAGRIVGMKGRDTTGQRKAKYLVVGSSAWSRDSFLYGHLHAMRTGPSGMKRQVWIVEGNIDAIRLCSVGLPSCAAGGTALSESQVRQSMDIGKTAMLVFDGDSAGRAAARKACRLYLSLRFPARVVLLPSGTDPDEIVLHNGRTALEALARKAPSAWSALVDAELAEWTGWKVNPSSADVSDLLDGLRPYVAGAHALDGVSVEASLLRIVGRVNESVHFRSVPLTERALRRWLKVPRHTPRRRRQPKQRAWAVMAQDG